MNEMFEALNGVVIERAQVEPDVLLSVLKQQGLLIQHLYELTNAQPLVFQSNAGTKSEGIDHVVMICQREIKKALTEVTKSFETKFESVQYIIEDIKKDYLQLRANITASVESENQKSDELKLQQSAFFRPIPSLSESQNTATNAYNHQSFNDDQIKDLLLYVENQSTRNRADEYVKETLSRLDAEIQCNKRSLTDDFIKEQFILLESEIQLNKRDLLNSEIADSLAKFDNKISTLNAKIDLKVDDLTRLVQNPMTAEKVTVTSQSINETMVGVDAKMTLQEVLSSIQSKIVELQAAARSLDKFSTKSEVAFITDRVLKIEEWKETLKLEELAKESEMSEKLQACEENMKSISYESKQQSYAVLSDILALQGRVEEVSRAMKTQESIQSDVRKELDRLKEEDQKLSSLKADKVDIYPLQETNIKAEAALAKLSTSSQNGISRDNEYYTKAEMNNLLDYKMDKCDFEDLAKHMIAGINPSGRKTLSSKLKPLQAQRRSSTASGTVNGSIVPSSSRQTLAPSIATSYRSPRVDDNQNVQVRNNDESNDSTWSLSRNTFSAPNFAGAPSGESNDDFAFNFDAYSKFKKSSSKSISKALHIIQDDSSDLKSTKYLSENRLQSRPQVRDVNGNSLELEENNHNLDEFNDSIHDPDGSIPSPTQCNHHKNAPPSDSVLMFKGKDGHYYYSDNIESEVNLAGDGLPSVKPIKPQPKQLHITRNRDSLTSPGPSNQTI